MMADYFAHQCFDDPKAMEEVFEDEGFNPDDVASLIGHGSDAPPDVSYETDPGDWEGVSGE